MRRTWCCWHRAARDATDAISPAIYPLARAHCDEYFFLKHRGEARGIGGIFYDDVNEQSPGTPLTLGTGLRADAARWRAFHDAYLEIMNRRRDTPHATRDRNYQLHRRGRYVEFNLVFDRGTLFGLQSGGRTEAILVSMPPEARWSYRSPDAEMDARLLPYLTTLRGKDWLALANPVRSADRRLSDQRQFLRTGPDAMHLLADAERQHHARDVAFPQPLARR